MIDDEDYTPTPRVVRPRCPECKSKLYWDGQKAKWWCHKCDKFFSRRVEKVN